MAYRLLGVYPAFIAVIRAAIHTQPIFLFKDYTGTCPTIATSWVNDENIVGNMMHIVGGTTTSMTLLTGVANGFCSSKTIPFLTIGFNDASAYRTHFFKE